LSERWSGRGGFILAATASAVGLGSIWKFPYEVGTNGGAAFVLFYVAGLALAVVPLMLAEFAIGRRAAGDAVTSLEQLAAAHGAPAAWRWVGVLAVAAGALILSYYSVIAGWTLAYAVDTVLAGLPGAAAAEVDARYDALLASPARMALYHALFMALAAAVVARGVSRGIEAASRALMPLLVALMFGLAAYACVLGDLAGTLRFLFRVELAQFTARAALEALGLGFFSIGVGFGLMITYAAYADRRIDLSRAAFWAVGIDTAISFAAGLAVFPLVFAYGLDPASGPGLVFVTLPMAFARMPWGALVALGFYLLLAVAALGSAISMLELAVAPVMRRWGWPRARASWAVAAACFVAGLASVFSFQGSWRRTPFELLDEATSNVMLPAGGLAIALFAGWVLPQGLLAEELGLGPRAARALRWALRWVTPLVIGAAALGPALA
jgi:NSS family neurotransmitter:Na+ symporter